MKSPTVLLGVVAILMASIMLTSSCGASDSFSGLDVKITPSQIRQGEETRIVLTIHNENSTSINLTHVGIQANMVQIYEWIADRQSFNGSEGYIPANSSKDIELTANTSFFGECKLSVYISGVSGDNKSVGDIFEVQMYIQPSQPLKIFGLDPLFFFASILITISLAVAAVYIFQRRR